VRREIRSAFGVPYPKIPGKTVRFFQEDGGSVVQAEVFAEGEELPEWSAERTRLEQAVSAVCRQYGVGLPVPAQRPAAEAEEW
jgi:hypothetical protein